MERWWPFPVVFPASRSHRSWAQPPKQRTAEVWRGAERPASEAAHAPVPAWGAGAAGSTPAPGTGRPHLPCIISFAYAFPPFLFPRFPGSILEGHIAMLLAVNSGNSLASKRNPQAIPQVLAACPAPSLHTLSASPTRGTAPEPQPGLRGAGRASVHTWVSASRAQ